METAKKRQNSITFLILAGREKLKSEPAVWVHKTKEAMVIDVLEKIRHIDIIDRIIISSNDRVFLETLTSLDSRIVADVFPFTDNFHFGKWLKKCIEKYEPDNLFYWGAGASPFITSELLESMCLSVAEGDNILYTNNFFSADWVAFTPASAALEIEAPPLDNNLAYFLWQQRGLRSVYIEPSVEIVGDVDTPVDLMVLSLHPKTSPNTADYIRTLNLNTSRMERFIKLLPHRSEIFLAGRVGSSLFKYLDTRCPCKFRILSEERGMRSSGRMKNGDVKSFLAQMIQHNGLDSVLSFFEANCKGMVIDSRVLFAHICGKVNMNDRFYSDLGVPEKIGDPFVAEFTERVKNSPIPILTGGHSLILGGMWALVSAFGELPAFY